MDSRDYDAFISRKLSTVPPTGLVGEFNLPSSLFGFQDALTRWALRRGRAAIFADTGLGKTRMQASWAAEVVRQTGAVANLAAAKSEQSGLFELDAA